MRKTFIAAIALILLLPALLIPQFVKPGSGGGGGGGGGVAGTDYAPPSLYDTHANIVAATCNAANSGRLAFSSNSIYTARCNGSTWDWFYKGKKVTLPTLTNFAWENEGAVGAAINATYGYLYMALPAGQPAVNFRMHVRTVPAAPYTFTTLIRENIHTTTYAYAGLVLRQDAANDNIHFGFNTRGGADHLLRVVSMTDNAAGGESVKASRTIANDEIWLRIVDNNTNHLFQWSLDGTTFYTLFSAARTSIITADQIGYQLSDENDLPVSMMVLSAVFE